MSYDKAPDFLRLLPLLALDAYTGPWDGVQAGEFDLLFTIGADSVGALINAMDRLFNRSEQLGIGLFQSQMDVKIALLTRLIHPVAALGAGLGCRRACGCSGQNFVALRFKDCPILAQFRWFHDVNKAV